MEKTHSYQLEEFVAELSAFSFSDVLVNINPENKAVFEVSPENEFQIPANAQFNQIYKLALKNKKNSDIESLCLVSDLISWKIKERQALTPFFLIPVKIKWNKVKQLYFVNVEFDKKQVNPFIKHYLKHECDLDLPEYESKTDYITYLEKIGFNSSFVAFSALGNFHYHRYELIKDLEEIIQTRDESGLLQKLLGNTPNNKSTLLNLKANNCYPSDIDQEEVFETLKTQDVVLQGPPGTGKSQVISNLFSKLLLHNKMQLLISEKKTALDVIEQKLEVKNLHHFIFLAHSQSKNSDFIEKLKNTWAFLEKLDAKPELNLMLSKQYLSSLQLNFDKLNTLSFWDKYTLHEIQAIVATEKFKKATYVTNLPEIKQWNQIKEQVASVYSKISNPIVLGKLKLNFFESEHPEEKITDIQSLWYELSKEFVIETLSDLEQLSRKAIRIQILYNDQFHKYKKLLFSNKDQKIYQKLKKEYIPLIKAIELNNIEVQHWKKIPSESELNYFKLQLNQGNWFTKRKIKKLLFTKLKTTQLDLNFLLDASICYHEQKKHQLELEEKLIDIGVLEPSLEINVIDYVLHEKNKFTHLEWAQIVQIENEKQVVLLNHTTKINQCLKQIKHNFIIQEDENIDLFLKILSPELEKLMLCQQELKSLPEKVYRNLNLCKNANDFELIVIKSNWTQFASNLPELADFSGKKLKTNLANIISEEHKEEAVFSSEIHSFRAKIFKDYQRILQTPATKLKGDEKELKAKLKIGKAILVKEFSKSRQHKSIRELLASDAHLWIKLLTPVHLSTSTCLSKNIPLHKEFFECVIFDEASQIPLPKAIPSLQRAERTLIAGDSQQMSPSTYFSSLKSGIDLLHQANYYLKQKTLKHHYRSDHPELIAFSNEHFYNNKLLVFPSANKVSKALNWHFCEDGFFENRENINEAKLVARLLETHLSSTKTLGLVAFSEQQLNRIYKEMNVKCYALIEKKLKNKTLFLKSLEQVQGEECDILIISLAYARNNTGEFHHRFGPLNQINGPKRLNVLLSRAKSEIHFCSSVRSSDFQISTNEGVNLLRLYLHNLEFQNPQDKLELPHQLVYSQNQNELTFPKINKQISDIRELKTLHDVLSNRSWKLEYTV